MMVLENIKESIKSYLDNLNQLHQLLEIELATSTYFFEAGHSSEYHKLEDVKWKLSDIIKILEYLM